jgi:hypothetical protein
VISTFVVALALLAGQLLIPELGERGIESRLTEGGGSAEVSLSALPALRLLFEDGDRLAVDASDLELEVEERTDVLGRLDGFDAVDVSLTDSRTGPFELESFNLTRDGTDPYRLVSSGRTSAQALAEYGFDSLGLPGGGLADMFLDRVLGEQGDDEVPVELDMELTSDDGRLRVISGGGTIAGFDTGPLAELVTTAIVVRL